MKSPKSNAGQDVFTLPIVGEMTIYQVAALKPVLLESLMKASALEIDLSGVTHIDTAGVQLLLMIKKVASETGYKLSLTRHSPAVLEAFDLINLAGCFGDQLLIQPETTKPDRRSTRSH